MFCSLRMLFVITFFCQAILMYANDTTIQLQVAGNCDLCRNRIQKAALTAGAIKPNWSEENQVLSFSYSPSQSNIAAIQQAILKIGHDVNNQKADSVAYQQLPFCCLYRKANHHIDNSQTNIKGVIVQENVNGIFLPVMNATLHWVGDNTHYKTDSNGVFTIPNTEKTNGHLTLQHDNFSDTIQITPTQHIFTLHLPYQEKKELNTITIQAKKTTVYISEYNALLTQIITEKELFKAACCNLSESFETNAAVDVVYSDAASGSKQIQMLGLSGIYTQMTIDNIPSLQGLATANGLNYLSGTFIESIQLTKGIGSVANGFDAIAGQINVALHQPQKAKPLYANIYVNDFGRIDANININHPIGKKWKAITLLHNDFLGNKNIDFDKNTFRDIPTGNLFSLVHQWQYVANSPWTIFMKGFFVVDKKQGGQINFNATHFDSSSLLYGLILNSTHLQIEGKLGYSFPQKKYQSIGLQLASSWHEQNDFFGRRQYDATQRYFYTNLLYQSIINNTNHKIRVGTSFSVDDYNEKLLNTNYLRTEIVTGAFAEYTFNHIEKFQSILGLRTDYNNLYGYFFTPRLHLKYQIIDGSILRFSVGKGQRTANIFAENRNVFLSNRNIEVDAKSGVLGYGLLPEVAWNMGLSWQQKVMLGNQKINFVFDFFRTDFINQVVVDMENARQVKFFNLQGASFSNSFQAELNTQFLKKINLRAAYRFLDVQTQYTNALLSKPFTARHRALFNLSYTLSTWQFDYTLVWNGEKRLPSTKDNPIQYQRQNYSPSFVIMNAQITKSFKTKMPIELYLGGENLSNFFQPQSVIEPENPFGKHFDGTIVWAPIFGRMMYAGIRMKL